MVALTVIEMSEPGNGIVQLKMQDRAAKNTFSAQLIHDLVLAFALVRADPRYKVVILTGYDTYFCSGGSQEGLLTLQEGKGSFTDTGIYSLPLECEIPVIAAMQGHGIGGGLVLGLFADFVILSRESFYTTNFMRYGFTPGMGATHVLPLKLGTVLATEMLFGTRNYRGADLERRGIAFPVLPRTEVLSHACELATEIAEKPRSALVVLKDHLVAASRQALPDIIRRELQMHDKTFHEPDVRERIAARFGQ